MLLWAQSSTKDCIRAEHKLHSISKLFISQVTIPQVVFFSSSFFAYLYSAGSQHGNPRPIGWPILFCGPTQEPVIATANAWEIGRGFGKNAGELTGKVEIGKEEIHGSKRSMHGYILTYSRFRGRTFKLCVSPDGALSFASAAPHYGRKITGLLLWTQNCQRFSLKAWAGQSIAMNAPATNRNFFLSNIYLPVHPISFVPNPLFIFPLVLGVANTGSHVTHGIKWTTLRVSKSDVAFHVVCPWNVNKLQNTCCWVL